MKKVLIVGMTRNQGGIETFVKNIVEGMIRADKYQFYILDTTNNSIAYEEELNRLKQVKIIKRQYPSGTFALFKRHSLATRLMKEFRFDIVHIQANNLNATYWAKIAYKCGVKKIIVHSHNTMNGHFGFLKGLIIDLLMPLQRRSLRKLSDHVIRLAASRAAGEWMFPNSKYQVIPNGVNTDIFEYSQDDREAMRNLYNVPTNAKVIVLVGRFSNQKNQERLLTIFQMIKEHNDDYFLWLVGTGENFSAIQQSVAENKLLSGSVVLLGGQKNVQRFLSAADLTIMPSLYEALPFAIIEAQASGIPGLVSSEAFSEEANLNGLIKCSLEDSDDDWAATAMQIIDNEPKDAQEYMNLRRDRNDNVAKSGFSVDATITRMLEIYQ
ncbi:glycosyltransferase [Furfurilactobacillus siliginis]|uniref:Glycosyl transferase n=1 Tax=Furfurilactobacillus siliginis TaxID=348151 RepID=A0A0R2L4D2_9LACO|nr:glycosyltransferase [Furfurilactobacillus siliginis]KRN96555.1 glycosyltransferase [Furfurilactobacillus siliginis]GEK29038.1 glycosyl transferase [Furfurilactobacillus siliginis]